MIDPGLRGRGVLITGANNRLGIGAAIALGFARLGATVFLHYHRASLQQGIQADAYRAEQAKPADEILKDLRNIGGRAAAYEADFSDLSTISRLFDAAENFCGGVDVLINNAAVFSVVPMNRGRIETIDPLEWDRLMAVNLRGLFFCCRAVLPSMRKQKSGKIITVASGTVFAGASGRIHYVTSKAATIGFTRTLARELGDDHINVNCLAPGNTLSEENPTEQMIKFRESSVGLRALKRIQMPNDVVGAMLFLASPLSDFITGQTINVDGGISFL